MEWKNAAKDRLPKDGEEVLISVNGVNSVAVFKKAHNAFVIKDKDTQVGLTEGSIYWASIARLRK